VAHVVLGVYIICFAGGVTLIVVSLLSSRRLALRGLRDFALMFASATLILVVEGVKTYEGAVAADFGAGLHVAAVILTLIGSAGLTWYLVSLSLLVVDAAATPRIRIALAALSVLVALIGGTKEAGELIWASLEPRRILWNAQYVTLLGIHIGAGAILFAGYGNIEHPRLRGIVRAFLIYLGIFSALAIVQLAVQDLPSAPPLVHDYPVEEALYYLGLVVAALVILARYFSEPTQGPPADLSDEFISRFGISAREREIIEMMARGLSNSAIAEKLFISTVTVKNHVYHIYQKTGVGNKVQLLNLMNSLK